MKKIFTILIAILVAFPAFSQIEKKVIIEHFTNTRCGICASKNPAFYETLEDYPNVLHIAYHPSSPYPSCVFSQHNPFDNDNRAYFYGVYGGTPRAVIQGEVLPVGSKLITADQIEEHLYQTSDYYATLTNESVNSESYKATLSLNRATGSGMQIVQVYIGVAEKEIQYSAPNGEELHHDVFRDRIFHDTTSVNVGDTKTIEVNYDLDPDWDLDQMYVYAIIQDQDNQMVLQSVSSLDSPSFIANKKDNELNKLFYPNPSSGKIYINRAVLNNIKKVELYSLTGSIVKSYDRFTDMDIGDLPQGIYFSKITDNSNATFTTRIIKSGN